MPLLSGIGCFNYLVEPQRLARSFEEVDAIRVFDDLRNLSLTQPLAGAGGRVDVEAALALDRSQLEADQVPEFVYGGRLELQDDRKAPPDGEVD